MMKTARRHLIPVAAAVAAFLLSSCATGPARAVNHLDDGVELRGKRVVLLSMTANPESLYVTMGLERALVLDGGFEVVTTDEIAESFPAYPATIAQGIGDRVDDQYIAPEELAVVLGIARELDADYAFVVDGWLLLASQIKGGSINLVVVSADTNLVDVAAGTFVGYWSGQSSYQGLMINPSDKEKIEEELGKRMDSMGRSLITYYIDRVKPGFL